MDSYEFNERKNNFNLLRFIAAFAVIFQHAPILMHHSFRFEYSKFFDVGSLAVDIFFLISGYLILGSWNSKGNKGYISARIFRIMPALIVVNAIVAFVMGPIVSNHSLMAYFAHSTPYIYFVGTSIFILTGRGVIKGVFGGQSPNGSLWTLLFEVSCYVFVWCLGMLKIINHKVIVACLVLLVFLTAIDIEQFFSFPGVFLLSITFSRLYICFLIGMLVQMHKKEVVYFIQKTKISSILFIFSIVVFNILAFCGVRELYLLPFIAYLVFYFAFCKLDFHKFGSQHDLSYGIYIYAYPIQMTIFQFFPEISLGIDILIVAIFSLLMSFVSFNLVEKPMLIAKKQILSFMGFNIDRL